MNKIFTLILLLSLLSGCIGNGGINSSGFIPPGLPSSSEDSAERYFIFENIFTQLFYESGNEKLFIYNDSSQKEEVKVSIVNYTTGEFEAIAYEYSLDLGEAKIIEPKKLQNYCDKEEICFESHAGSKTFAQIYIDGESEIDTVEINSSMNIGHLGSPLSHMMNEYFVSNTFSNEITVRLDKENISKIVIPNFENTYGFTIVDTELVESSAFDITYSNTDIILVPKVANTEGLEFKINIKSTKINPVELLIYDVTFKGESVGIEQRIAFPLKD